MIFPLKILKMLKSKLKGLKPMERYKIKFEDHDKKPCVQFINAKNDSDLRHKVINTMDMSLMEKKSTVITKLIKL